MSNEDYGQAFREEAHDLLIELENGLLELEEYPDDAELIGRVFRALHTIKGSGAMFGFEDIASFTHEVETAFDMVRSGQIPVTTELINLTLAAKDQIRILLQDQGGKSVDQVTMNSIIDSFKNIIENFGAPVSEPEVIDKIPTIDEITENLENLLSNHKPETENSEEKKEDDDVIYRIRFKPDENIFLTGTDPICLLRELQELGQCDIVGKTGDIPTLEDYNPDKCYMSWDILLTTSSGVDAIRDIFIFVEDSCELNIDIIDYLDGCDSAENCKRLGEILQARGEISSSDLEKSLHEQKKIGEILIDKGVVTTEQVRSALVEQKHVKEAKTRIVKEEVATSIKVSSEKLDKLVDLVGELVIAQAHLSQTAYSKNDSELLSIAEEVERLTVELRDNTLNIRMLPIGSTFGKFKRLVRDLSSELGKEVILKTDGAETELDKTVIEKLDDPLVHLIRNCIDHGIESPDVRRNAGKTPQGTVFLSAVHSGAEVLIQIKDDGAGMDKNAILSKAVEKGLVAPDAELSEKEIFSLVFLPGFSTAGKITSVSGRGVGLDVVKKSIESLRGSIEVESKKYHGSTITLKLPLTLAIIEGLLVTVGNDYFVIPLSKVEECIELTKHDTAESHGRNIAHVRGEIVPYIRLKEHFRITEQPLDIEQIVITRIDEHRVGFVVDKVIGEYQTVIKTLGSFYKDISGVSGATILGDGNVALILDIPRLTSEAENDEKLVMCQ